MSFYRIYRPQTIEEIDNVAVREHLISFLSKDRDKLPHAFLFTGPKGSGKTTAARIVAKLFNCLHLKSSGPCGSCDQCESIARGRSMDVIEIDAASNRGIDDIRQLRDGVNLSPVSGTYKIYIIDEVHMLTPEAFNALLKTLEEPPKHAIFVLATTDSEKIPATIRSRCVSISFHKADMDELLHALSRIVKKEKIPIEAEALSYIASFSDGAFRDAVKILEQVSFLSGSVKSPITISAVKNALSVTDSTFVSTLMDALLSRDSVKALSLVRGMVDSGKDVKQCMVDVLTILHEKLLTGAGQAEGSISAEYTDLIRRLTEAYGMMRICPVEELPLEMVILEYCQPAPHVQQGIKDDTDKTKVSDEGGKGPEEKKSASVSPQSQSSFHGLSVEKLKEHWQDVIGEAKPFNHSVAGMLRSTRPLSVTDEMITIEAFYPFHQERLSEPRVRDMLATVLKKLFGVKMKVEIVLGKK